METTLILLAAGSSSRFSKTVKKQWLPLKEGPLWRVVAQRLETTGLFEKVIVVASHADLLLMQRISPYTIVCGGAERQESLQKALEYVQTPWVMTTDAARPCVPSDLLKRLFDAAEGYDCVIPTLRVADTITYHGTTIDRNCVRIIQTPQLSRTTLLRQALKTDKLFTDDSSAIKEIGGRIKEVEGSIEAHKLTTIEDLRRIPCLMPPTGDFFVGTGFDVHPFEEGKAMVLGGVTIDAPYGFKAHSDGDVALHALIDALLGACGIGDIGELFPDTERAYAGIDSSLLLQEVYGRIVSIGYIITHVDITIIAEAPRINPFKDRMRMRLAELLKLDPMRVNVKATTTEKLGFVGRKEGVAVMATATVRYWNWISDENFDR
ncbi:MAG: bifunctional 2-C-methyl-D-erythritol 4-phosphate cytidylyltransferase/2-C-methyl-D-erythritol 2,4-cyclodiphosphate synthase [Campylobacterales bacterium]